jgi:hypothetical protein
LEEITKEYQKELGLMKDNLRQLQDTQTRNALASPKTQGTPKINSATFAGNGVTINGK